MIVSAEEKPPIWAPWRMEYILSPKDKDAGARPGSCIFCNFPSASPATFRVNLVLVSNPHYAVMLNRYPFAAGHLLVIPRRHAAHLGDLPLEENDSLFRAVRDVGMRLRSLLKPNGVNYGINEGVAAGAGIAEHLHVHLVPRWSGDTNFMPVLADLRVMPEHLDDTWRRLYPAFADLEGAAPPP
ncbi:MAG: HIT family protein [Polyangiales bacterium]